MKLDTNYALKLFFPNSAFIQIYFEAVANAFDAGASEIDINISTDGELRDTEHLVITISDNGVGLTPERYGKFKEIKEPTDPDHKGLGRLVYLRYFSAIRIESYYDKTKRMFIFTDTFDGESTKEHVSGQNFAGTKLTFKSFIGDRIKTYEDLKPASLKDRLMEQFLPRLIEMKKAEKQFKISIKLNTESPNPRHNFFPDEESLSLEDIPEFKQKTIKDKRLDAFSDINISYLVRKNEGLKENLTAVCIDGRTIRLKLLQPNTIPVNYSVIFLIESDMFTGKSDNSRQKLVLPNDVSETAFFKRLRKEISQILNKEIPEIKKRNIATRKQLLDRYPHLFGFFDEDIVGLINRDEAIEIAQKKFFKDQKEILDSDSLDDSKFKKSLNIASRTLTEYILYRELIIKRLGEIKETEDEIKIHNLFVPRYKIFQEDDFINNLYSNNAWLLDDKFMTFRTILSEARMEDIFKAITLEEDQERDDGRPDIAMIFSGDPSDQKNVDVVVVELKKRKVDAKENLYAVTQLVQRARKLVAHCNNIQRVWYYAVIEIDDELSQTLQAMNWIPLFSKDKVFYQDFKVQNPDGQTVLAPTFLLSYNAIIMDAAARNHTFLEILKNDIQQTMKNTEYAVMLKRASA
jgi:hypothetical protein